jgi:predicted alpha/beta superfamily hydrolase
MSIVASFGLLALAQLAAGEVQGIEGVHGLGEVRHHELVSERADHRYDILVGLPGGSDAETRYPVVYVLDAGTLFPLLQSYQRYLRLGEETPDIILVGISYGTDDWEQGNNRSHDFTAPSDERDYWGGAADFLDFLEFELIPFIESRYAADAGRRIVFGQSLGGQFVLFAAQTRPGVFWGHIASNPALHRNLPFFLDARPDISASMSKLFVASGAKDDPVYRGPALEWMATWNDRPELPWELKTATLDGHSHFSAAPAAYRAGMHWLFER